MNSKCNIFAVFIIVVVVILIVLQFSRMYRANSAAKNKITAGNAILAQGFIQEGQVLYLVSCPLNSFT
jgi:hypothetical protein